MSGVVAVYLFGVFSSLIVVAAYALSDHTNGDSPRQVFGAMARRVLMGLVWPVAVPVYMGRAIARDEW